MGRHPQANGRERHGFSGAKRGQRDVLSTDEGLQSYQLGGTLEPWDRAHGQHHEQWQAGSVQCARNCQSQPPGTRINPVCILEDQDERALGSPAAQQLDQQRLTALVAALGFKRRSEGRLREAGTEQVVEQRQAFDQLWSDLGHLGVHQAAALVRSLYPAQLEVGIKNLAPGAVGGLTLAAVASAGQDGEATGVAQAGQLLQQA